MIILNCTKHIITVKGRSRFGDTVYKTFPPVPLHAQLSGWTESLPSEVECEDLTFTVNTTVKHGPLLPNPAEDTLYIVEEHIAWYMAVHPKHNRTDLLAAKLLINGTYTLYRVENK